MFLPIQDKVSLGWFQSIAPLCLLSFLAAARRFSLAYAFNVFSAIVSSLGRGSGDCGRNLANKFGAGDLSISSIVVYPVHSHTVEMSQNSIVCSISNHRF
jgi:hypothetical protein